MKEVILSASQIQTYQDCNRKWGFKYLDGLEAPPHPSAELGSRAHEVLAQYLTNGKPPDLRTKEGAVALAGIRFLPAPGVAQVEQFFTYEDHGIRYRGYIDFQFEDHGTTIIGDHKTTAAFSWAKSPADLATDIQATIYAKNAFLTSKKDSVRLRWVYYRTKGRPQAKLVEIDYSYKHLKRTESSLLPVSQEMVNHHAQGRQAQDLKANWKSCFKYGACAFLSRCNELIKNNRPNFDLQGRTS